MITLLSLGGLATALVFIVFAVSAMNHDDHHAWLWLALSAAFAFPASLRHPAAAAFTMAFAISCAAIYVALAPVPFSGDSTHPTHTRK